MRNSFTDILGTLAGSSIQKRAIFNPEVLNEAYVYATASSFSRGMRIDLGELSVLLISATASMDEHGNSVHIGHFRAQMRRTLHNITGLLAAERATWYDIVRHAIRAILIETTQRSTRNEPRFIRTSVWALFRLYRHPGQTLSS
jgi:hypothetical protein